MLRNQMAYYELVGVCETGEIRRPEVVRFGQALSSAPGVAEARKAVGGNLRNLCFTFRDRAMATGLRDAMRRPISGGNRARARAAAMVGGLRDTVALAVETDASGHCRVIAISDAGIGAFGLAQSDAATLSLGDFERRLGIGLPLHLQKGVAVEIVTTSHGPRYFEVTSFPIHAVSGLGVATRHCRYDMLTFRDVTDAMQAEQALRTARDAAQKEAERLSALVGRFNHDLRTPLNAVIGFASLLKGNQDNLPDQRTRKQVDLLAMAADDLKELLASIPENTRAAHPMVTAAGCPALPAEGARTPAAADTVDMEV